MNTFTTRIYSDENKEHLSVSCLPGFNFPSQYSVSSYHVAFVLFSQSEHNNAVDALNKMLNEVESGLSDAEHKKPVYDENDSVDLEAVMGQMEKQKVRIDMKVCLI